MTPVLYVRGHATRLFTLASPRPGGYEAPPGQQASAGSQPSAGVQGSEPTQRRRAELSALYVAARAELRLQHFETAISLFDDLLTLDLGYLDAAGLRDTARRGARLANAYLLAATAEEAGDWIAAARGFEQVLEIDPSYRDAAARKEACQTRQRVADLQAELRQHADAGQWQAVADVDAELAGLDRSASDPDGLASRARDALAAEQLMADLGRRYAQARAAADGGDWAAAARGFEQVLEIDPSYRDAAARKEACQTRQWMADLQAALRLHADAGQWQAVADVDAELAGLDQSASDPDGLASRARDALAAQARKAFLGRLGDLMTALQDKRAADLESRYAQASAAADGGDWAAATRGYEQVLEIDPSYRDAGGRRDLCQQAARVQSDLDQQAAAEDWPRVLATLDELSGLDPGMANKPRYARLAARARLELADHPAGPLWRINEGHAVEAVSWHPDGRRIAIGYGDAEEGSERVGGRVYDISGVKPKALTTIKTTGILAVAFSPDGTRLATGSFASAAVIWDAASGEKLREFRHQRVVPAVAFSSDGTRLATGSWDQSARVWDAASGEQLLKVRIEVRERPSRRRFFGARPQASPGIPEGAVRSVAFSPDGTRLATASYDDHIRVWDAVSGEKLLEVRSPVLTMVAFSPDGTRLAVGAWPGAQVWDTASGEKLLEMHFKGVTGSVAFSPDGTRLATASREHAAQVWNATSGEKLLDIDHDGAVTTVAFSPDGNRLATGSADMSVQIWSVIGL